MKIRDIILAIIIIALLFFSYIKPEDSDAPGAVLPAPKTSVPTTE